MYFEIGDDILDLRELWERYEELKAIKDSLEPCDVPDDYDVTELAEDDEAVTRLTCGTCGRSWDDAVITSMTPAPTGRCPFEFFHPGELLDSEKDELKVLDELFAEVGEPYRGGEFDQPTLIRDSYFEDYARQYAEGVGAIDDDARWPATCIDWEKAASELQMDYSPIELDGITYWQGN